MKTKLLAALVVVMTSQVEFAQPTFEWAKGVGASLDDEGTSIALDGQGNLYTTGHFRSTVDFDSGTGTYNLSSNAASIDIFISKLDTDGNFVWAKSMGASQEDRGTSISIDGSDNVLTTGFFTGTVDFDPGAGTSNLVSSGGKDIFISKLDISGNLIWARSFGSNADDAGYAVATDAAGNVYVSGYFQGTIDFDPSSGTFLLTSNGIEDIFVLKLDASGNFLWAANMGSSSGDFSYSLDVDLVGNLFFTGTFSNTTDFDPGTGTFNLTSNGADDIFISKLDANGNFLWAKSVGWTSTERANSIAVDAGGNAILTGSFSGIVDFNPGAANYNLTSAGSTDVFVLKLDSQGNFVWAKNMGGPSSSDVGWDVALDQSGSVYTVGYFTGTADFDPGSGVNNLFTEGDGDIFITKLDASGNFAWARGIGGVSNDYGRSIAVDNLGSVYAAGYFSETIFLDQIGGSGTLSSLGYKDVFFTKFSQSMGTTEVMDNEQSVFNLNPNPASNTLMIKGLTESRPYQIVNTLGEIVQHGATSNDAQINIKALVSGIYFVQVENSSAIRFIKE